MKIYKTWNKKVEVKVSLNYFRGMHLFQTFNDSSELLEKCGVATHELKISFSITIEGHTFVKYTYLNVKIRYDYHELSFIASQTSNSKFTNLIIFKMIFFVFGNDWSISRFLCLSGKVATCFACKIITQFSQANLDTWW